MSGFRSFWKRLTDLTVMQTALTKQPSATPISNLTPRAQQVLLLARQEAERLNHNFIGTEHLLLGLLALGRGVAVNVLQKKGVDLETVRIEVKNYQRPAPDQSIMGNAPYTPRTKKVLALAAREAKALNHTYVGTEHVLLGLLREGDGIASQILRKLGMNPEETRREIIKELDPNFPTAPDAPGNSPSATSAGPSKAVPQSPNEPVDISKRYDVHCTDWSQGVTIYRNVRFKGVKHLFPKSQYDVLSGYAELEQENGQSVFVSRGSIVRFTEAGVTPGSEGSAGKKE